METPAIFHAPERPAVAAALAARLSDRLAGAPPAAIADLLADTVFHERKRLEKDTCEPEYEAALDAAVASLRGMAPGDMVAAARGVVACYAREIHNRFSPRAYRFATTVMPGALTRLLSASRTRDLLFGEFDPRTRIRLGGPLDRLRALSRSSTLILAPTHVSNLDSPLIGYSLFAAGLPPFAYGAGLNLFSNAVMAFWMSRLGAYTVDRRKRNRLYKDTLKDYSIEILGRGTHSLFFPGGTRSRSGRLETRLKKGLLGTGLAAWQEGLAASRPGADVFIVPCTLSIGLVLEAETLIADALAEEGKQRYIIMDDEFSEARTVASFVRRLMALDAAVHVVFGEPMDVAGNPLDEQGRSVDPRGRPVDRRGYVTDRNGRVVADEQRDHGYTERVAERLADAYARDFVVQSTHLAAWAAWQALRRRHRSLDTWRLVRLHPADRKVDRAVLERLIAEAPLQGHARSAPADAGRVLDEALERFSHYHRKRALAMEVGSVVVEPELALYYANRLSGFPGMAC